MASVVTSGDPAAAYAALSPSERQAFDFYHTAGTVEESQGTVTPMFNDSGGGGGGSGCWTITKTVSYKNYYGTILWSWNQRGDWCGNGSTITSTLGVSWWPVVRADYWQVNSNYNHWTSGGVGHSYWRSFAQAEFKWCPPGFGCQNYRYPYIDMTMRPNGWVDGSLGT